MCVSTIPGETGSRAAIDTRFETEFLLFGGKRQSGRIEIYEYPLIKIDLLSVEGFDRIQTCLELLIEQNYIKQEDTLRKTYEKAIGVYNLERDDPKMWELLCQHKVNALFQMEGQTGIQGIKALKPNSVDDLAILNSTIRLMAQKKGDEMPTDKCARFKKDKNEWIRETERYGLTQKDRDILWPILESSYGLCITQEQFMQLVQLPELGGFSLTWADKLRKSIAKKSPKDYEALTKEFFAITKEKGCNPNLCDYVWNVLIAMSRGYGFNSSHTLAYSIVALQELNLAYKFPIIFWNTACLITDSGGSELEEIEEEVSFEYEDSGYSILEDFSNEDSNDEELEDENDEDNEETKTKKKAARAANYGKIASAIGKMKMSGIDVSTPNINKSTFTFSADVENNKIIYGLSGIVRIGENLIKEIIANRPYLSIEDFLNKVKVNKPQMVNLIKCGAFDEFGDRKEVMRHYITLISAPKKRVTLQNMKMLIDFGLLPDDFHFQIGVYNLNKYIKKLKIDNTYYGVDEAVYDVYEKFFDIDLLLPSDDNNYNFKIKQSDWDKIYQSNMDVVRPYIKSHSKELLEKINQRLIDDLWDKYCGGSISKWEMDSISFYSHEHELANIDNEKYGIVDFFKLPDEPIIDRKIPTKDGKIIPLLKLFRIAGTVLDKNKGKRTITLLTTSGVVTVKIFGDLFTAYDKQISEKGEDGKKHVIEKSFLSRGNKIIITGIRRDNNFIGKTYAKTPYHTVELIKEIDPYGNITLQRERIDAGE